MGSLLHEYDDKMMIRVLALRLSNQPLIKKKTTTHGIHAEIV